MIHGNLWSREIREYRLMFFLFFLLAAVISLLFPFFGDRVIIIPEGFRLWEGITAPTLGDQPWVSWSATALLHFSAVLALLMGYPSLAGELATGTTAYLLSKPVTPREIVATKAIAGLTLIAFFVYGLSFIYFVLLFDAGYQVKIIELFLSCTVTFVICAVMYLTTVLFSSLFTKKWTAGLFSGIFWGSVFIFGMLEPTCNFSIIYHLRMNGYWEGQQTFIPIGLGIFVGGLLLELAVGVWERREY
ncbi:MAG: ABC transporter permease subunit [Firmicutes bacterium]|nr:ABC transporter permease subunit [Bacillota bacterium]